MGRTHSNAFRKVNQFFDLDYRPVLKAVCGRNEANVKAFAEQWGYESIETDWRKLLSRADIDLIDIATPNDTPRRDRDCRGAGGQDGHVREAARPQCRPKPRRMVGGGRSRPRAEYGLVQLPPRAGGHARQSR